MLTLFKRLLRDENGAAIVEYGLLGALIALVVLTVVSDLRHT